jgi:hypothetical protein
VDLEMRKRIAASLERLSATQATSQHQTVLTAMVAPSATHTPTLASPALRTMAIVYTTVAIMRTFPASRPNLAKNAINRATIPQDY